MTSGNSPSRKLRVAVLGATGAVGQRFVQLLQDHPWFEVAHLAASERSSGKPYHLAAHWRLSGSIPASAADVIVSDTQPVADIDLAFSALDASVASDIEGAWAAAGVPVFSNARNFRMDPDVPLVIPEVNAAHLALIKQQDSRGFAPGGFLVTNANCSTTFLAMALAPLHRAFGLRQVHVVTMQAVSGAGYPGVPSMDILGNVVPNIPNEEGKIETETLKILGTVNGGQITPAEATISAQVNRVPVADGHLEAVSMGFARSVSARDVHEALSSFSGDLESLHLPSAPARPIVVLEEDDRPQPLRDVMSHGGMVALVGRIRPCPVLGIKMVVLGHNTIRGAAGGSLLNAELAWAKGYVGVRT